MTVQIRATTQGLVLPYEFVAHTYSTLTFAAHVSQNELRAGRGGGSLRVAARICRTANGAGEGVG